MKHDKPSKGWTPQEWENFKSVANIRVRLWALRAGATGSLEDLRLEFLECSGAIPRNWVVINDVCIIDRDETEERPQVEYIYQDGLKEVY